MDKSSIAVLIASYNAAQFLDVTLQGIAWQTLPATEVIIVDDCSSDETRTIVDSWLGRLPITYIRNESNLGVGPSRNIGLLSVRSSLVAVLDADDLWLPSHLESLVDCLHDDRTIVSPLAAVWHQGIGLTESQQYAVEAPKKESQFKSLCKENYVFSGSLFPISMIEEIGDFPDVRIGEDHLLWLKAVSRGYVIVKPKFRTVLYRRHEGSLSVITSALFKSLQESILQNIENFNPEQQRLLNVHVRDLKMRELLSSHDERPGTFLQSAFSNLFPVIVRGELRLKFSAIARLLLIKRSPRHQ